MTLDESVHGMRLRVIERAQVHGNVSAVCRELGISRTVFYRWRQRLERYGVDGVHPRRQRAQAGRPVTTTPEVERLVLGIAISAATWGCRRIAAYLARTWRVRLAPSLDEARDDFSRSSGGWPSDAATSPTAPLFSGPSTASRGTTTRS